MYPDKKIPGNVAAFPGRTNDQPLTRRKKPVYCLTINKQIYEKKEISQAL